MLLTVGGSGQALAQQVTNLPLVQAVVKTTSAVSTPVSTSSTDVTSDEAVAREAGTLQRADGALRAGRQVSAGRDTAEANAMRRGLSRGRGESGRSARRCQVIMNGAAGKFDQLVRRRQAAVEFSFVNPRRAKSAVDALRPRAQGLGVTRLAVAGRGRRCRGLPRYHADYGLVVGQKPAKVIRSVRTSFIELPPRIHRPPQAHRPAVNLSRGIARADDQTESFQEKEYPWRGGLAVLKIRIVEMCAAGDDDEVSG